MNPIGSDRISTGPAIALESCAAGFLGVLGPIGLFTMAWGHSQRDPQVQSLGGLLFGAGFLCGGVLAIIATVFSSMLLYRVWKAIPTSARSTSPGEAIGFCFIPLFNLYWFFVAYAGFVRIAEDFSGRSGPRKMAAAHAICKCICVLTAWNPVLLMFVWLPSYLTWLVTIKGMAQQAQACLEATSAIARSDQAAVGR